jgi:ubiquinone/menaquinone biosynthesis C-methylase UbiE
MPLVESKQPLDLSKLEDRKLKEIEHSRKRRTVLQGYERRSDTHPSEQASGLDALIRDREAFENVFANVKYYSITHESEKYQHSWMQEHCVRGTHVIDFACGNGENGIFAANCGATVTGIDISAEGVANANANAQDAGVGDHCHFEVMDGENLQFPDNTFDYGVEYGALHHVDLDKALAELARVIKPRGQMICVEALRHNPVIHTYRRLTPQLRTKWEVDHILGIDSLNTARKHFANVEARFFHLAVLGAVPFRKTPLFGRIREVLDRVDRRLLATPAIGKYAWIMIFVMRDPRK